MGCRWEGDHVLESGCAMFQYLLAEVGERCEWEDSQQVQAVLPVDRLILAHPKHLQDGHYRQVDPKIAQPAAPCALIRIALTLITPSTTKLNLHPNNQSLSTIGETPQEPTKAHKRLHLTLHMVHGTQGLIQLQLAADRIIQVVEVVALCLDADLAMGYWLYDIESLWW